MLVGEGETYGRRPRHVSWRILVLICVPVTCHAKAVSAAVRSGSARSIQGGHGHAHTAITITRRQETRVWVQPRTYHRHQVVLNTSKLEAVDATAFSVRVLLLSLQRRRLLQLRARAVPSSQWPSPVGVHAWAAGHWAFLQESPRLAVRIPNKSTVFSFELPGPARAEEKPHSPPRKRVVTWHHVAEVTP